jgi:hypothetical protein
MPTIKNTHQQQQRQAANTQTGSHLFISPARSPRNLPRRRKTQSAWVDRNYIFGGGRWKKWNKEKPKRSAKEHKDFVDNNKR